MLETVAQHIATSADVPVDQVRCVILMFSCFPLAFVFRHVLHPLRTALYVRHLFSTLTGLTLATLCFGWGVVWLALFVGVSYGLLLIVPPQSVHRYTMVWVMSSLSVAHLYRTLTDYGGWHVDFTGPMMILVQKLSLVAFAVRDGMGNSGPLNDDQKKQKLSSVPSVLEYMSYCFNFHSVLAGPAVTMRDHLTFMDGSNMHVAHAINNNGNKQLTTSEIISKEPSAVYPVISKLVTALVAMSIHAYFFNSNVILQDAPSNRLQGMLYFYLVMFFFRCRFYFVFALNDSISNAAGLGFEGYDSHGNPKWDLASNVNIVEMELSVSLRTTANTWNVTTSRWLRRVCYERVSWQPTLLSFTLSALWHGFYPGYYCCFVGHALTLVAAKKMRRWCNPFFTSRGPVVKWCYDVFTWTLTQIYVYYNCIPMLLLWLPDSWTFYQYHYFIPTLVVVCVVALVPDRKRHRHTVGDKGEEEKPLVINEDTKKQN